MRKQYSKTKEIKGKTPEERRQEAVRRAMGLLLYKDRTVRELQDRLAEDGYTEEECETALTYVSSFGYLNDRRYAENFIHKKGSTQSRSALAAELRRAGVEEGLISETMEDSPWEESQVMQNLLQKRYGEPHRLEEKEVRRAWGYLGRRGFSGDGIRRSLAAYQERAEQA